MSEATENHTITNIGAGIAKAVMNSNPITGFVQTIYDEYASRQWQQRREKWEEVFEGKLKDIQNDVDFLKINSIPNFAQILANATQGAMSDIEEDKVGLYANTVINSIKNENVDNTKTHIFLNILRELSYLHLQVLKEIQSFVPSSSFEMNQLEISDPKRRLLKQINQKFNNNSLISIIIKNLFEKNLIEVEHLVDMHMRGSIVNDEYLPQALSPLGQEFLQFIAEQEKSDE